MDRDEIQQWLCGPAAQVPSPATVAGLLGLPVAQLADTTMLRTAARVESLRFTLALLRDRFENDFDVHIWLDEPRYVLGGHSAREALLAGRCASVEELAMDEWRQMLLETQAV